MHGHSQILHRAPSLQTVCDRPLHKTQTSLALGGSIVRQPYHSVRLVNQAVMPVNSSELGGKHPIVHSVMCPCQCPLSSTSLATRPLFTSAIVSPLSSSSPSPPHSPTLHPSLLHRRLRLSSSVDYFPPLLLPPLLLPSSAASHPPFYLVSSPPPSLFLCYILFSSSLSMLSPILLLHLLLIFHFLADFSFFSEIGIYRLIPSVVHWY